MKRIILSLVTTSFLATSGAVASTNAELEAKLKILEEQMAEIKKELTKTNTTLTKTKSTLNEVKAHDAFDNIKWSMDFRNSVDFINYDYNSYEANGEDLSGTSASNDGLLTSRLYLNMKAAPTDKLMFSGQLAMYGIWGGELHADDAALKTWVGSSRADDTLFRIRQAYFVWSDTFGEDGLPYAFSIGRRQSTDGFLANHRENMTEPGSPLAHITNMEVDGAMLKLDLDEYVLPGLICEICLWKSTFGRHRDSI